MTRMALIGLVILLGGCSYNAQVVSTSAPASEIRLDRVRDARAALILDSEIETLRREVKPSSYVCTFHDYPLDIGQSIKQSIRSVIDSSFREMEFVGVGGTASGHDFTFKFDLTDFVPTISFASGFWQGTANANVELVMRVTVMDSEGQEILRTTIAGEGNAQQKGGCGDGAQALADAGQESVKRLLENFVYKVINSDQLDRA